MKIALCVGHSKLKNSCYTSADGTKFGGCNEYKYNKVLARYLVEELKKKGHTVNLIICPEGKFINSTEEKAYKLAKVNSGNYNLCIELHLNAAGETAQGAEVLYTSTGGKRVAEKIQKQLATLFKDRGVKKRTDLYMLNGTKPVTVIVETFFCTNKADYAKGKNYKKVAMLIAKGIG